MLDASASSAPAGRDPYLTRLLIPAAALGAAGSLALSLGLGLRACPLCFYQRAFALVALAALVLARQSAHAEGRGVGLRVAWAAGLGGLGVALFHVYLEVSGALECPAGLLGLGTAPQQSLAFFAVFGVLLGTRVLARGAPRRPAVVATGLGVLLAVASLVANPPPPAAPTKPYAEPPVVCRPPYRSSA